MKKLLVGFGALLVAIITIPMFAAFEAHVVNVTATIENALYVHPQSIEYGTVFPQEYLLSDFFVTFSESFSVSSQTRVGKIDYIVKQKPQCVEPDGDFVQVGHDEQGNFVCPEGSTMRPSLCPFLSKHPDNTPSTGANAFNDIGVPAFHDPNATSSYAYGKLVKLPTVGRDSGDTWTIDLAVPCFEGMCAQDWADFVHDLNPNADPDAYMLDPTLEHETFGCDLWVEVTKIY